MNYGGSARNSCRVINTVIFSNGVVDINKFGSRNSYVIKSILNLTGDCKFTLPLCIKNIKYYISPLNLQLKSTVLL